MEMCKYTNVYITYISERHRYIYIIYIQQKTNIGEQYNMEWIYFFFMCKIVQLCIIVYICAICRHFIVYYYLLYHFIYKLGVKKIKRRNKALIIYPTKHKPYYYIIFFIFFFTTLSHYQSGYYIFGQSFCKNNFYFVDSNQEDSIKKYFVCCK